MRKITEYLRNALIASTQDTIDFRDSKFETISYEDIEKGSVPADMVSFLWKNKEITAKEMEEDEKSKDVILAVKTIATEFLDHVNESNKLEEMTCIFFVPARVDTQGNLHCPKEGKWPWIPREFLDDMQDAQLIVGNVDEVDTYLEKTTDERNKIETWQEYLTYAKKMYSKVTRAEYDDDFVMCASEKIKTDGKCYIFADETVNAISNILRLYNHLLETDENALYNKMTNGQVEVSKPLISTLDTEKMKEHMGQMNGEYSLSPSQREAIHHVSELHEGEVLAVSGPPGTGKTTLLQSVVASEYVARALDEKDAPIIVAASTNNQAVTNIIDSFGKISTLGIENLEERWLSTVRSFATYFPSTSKIKEAKEKEYQYTDVNGNGFIEEMEGEENRKDSKNRFLNEFQNYYKKDITDLKMCKGIILENLRHLDSNRIQCLSAIVEIKNILGNQTYESYLSDLDSQINSAKCELTFNKKNMEKVSKENRSLLDRKKEWQESYNKLPWYVRLFKFLSCMKKQITNWIYDFMHDSELHFLQRSMDINQIQEAYMKLIDTNDNVIRDFEIKNQSIDNRIRMIKSKNQQIVDMVQNLRKKMNEFENFNIFSKEQTEEDIIKEFDVNVFNNIFDKVRYAQFWLAVHYYECRWLIEERGLKEKQIGKTYENVLDKLYKRLAMLSPCMVMTFHSLPKQFCAYVNNEKKHTYMSNYIDLLIVDEAGQTSPEIALPSFYLAKKAIVVGDEQQISPVWGIRRPLDIALARKNGIIQSEDEFHILEDNGLNCSQSSIMKVAGLSCAFNKYERGLFLSEHRRCYDEIIEYCNELVYNGRLEPLRGRGEGNIKNPLNGVLPVLGYKNINSLASMRMGGSRYNKEEAEQIALWIKENFGNLREKYPEIDESEVLGVITPFKAQSSMIKAQIQKIAPEYKKNITVGTVHTFQGGERQIIIFSSVYGKTDGCFFINKNKNLMNVAVSRPKDSFLVFGERDCLIGGEHSAAGLLKKMLKEEID